MTDAYSNEIEITAQVCEVVETMEADGQAVAVEAASVRVEAGSHLIRFLYVPSTKGDGTAVFASNLRVDPEEAESFCGRYSRRWQIENEYKSIKGDFLAKTSSKDYRVRLFYFVFAVLLYNIWRLTDFLLKVGVDGDMDYAPVLTAGECVELVASALIPLTERPILHRVRHLGVTTLSSSTKIRTISHAHSIISFKMGGNRVFCWMIGPN